MEQQLNKELEQLRFEKTAALQVEFGDFETYFAYLENMHNVRFSGNKPTQEPQSDLSEGQARAQFDSSADLQAEFGNFDTYWAYCSGQVKTDTESSNL
jgi:hypothetical protein